jgi:hypothetical protein
VVSASGPTPPSRSLPPSRAKAMNSAVKASPSGIGQGRQVTVAAASLPQAFQGQAWSARWWRGWACGRDAAATAPIHRKALAATSERDP